MLLPALLLCLRACAAEPALQALARYSQGQGYAWTKAELRQVLDQTSDRGAWDLEAAERELDRRAWRPAAEHRRPHPIRGVLTSAAARAVGLFPDGPGLDRLFDKRAERQDAKVASATPIPALTATLRARLLEIQDLMARPYEDIHQPWADSRWGKIAAILATAKNAGEFDYL